MIVQQETPLTSTVIFAFSVTNSIVSRRTPWVRSSTMILTSPDVTLSIRPRMRIGEEAAPRGRRTVMSINIEWEGSFTAHLGKFYA